MQAGKHGTTATILLAAASAWLGASPAGAQSASPQTQQPPPALATVNSAPQAPQGSISIGGDLSEGSRTFYGGVNWAADGNLYGDGVMLRASVASGQYKAGLTPTTIGNVDFFSASALIGYQQHIGRVVLGGYVGPELIHNGEGAAAGVRGTKLAARFVGEFVVPTQGADFSIWSTYSTFENQYFVQGRANIYAGRNVGFGPDIADYGGDGWERFRLGGHLAFPVAKMSLGLAAGYDWDARSDYRESAYGNVSLSIPF